MTRALPQQVTIPRKFEPKAGHCWIGKYDAECGELIGVEEVDHETAEAELENGF